jgi:tRNA threonylcarbamoyladenosine biosynthesis protein TsaB
MRHGHAEALLPMIDRVMTAAGLTPAEIASVAVSVGPGGFTGIRAGLAAAQGLALASGARLVGVTSFATVAARLSRRDEALLVALDSRREDLYVQLFSGDGALIGEPAAIPPAELATFVAAAIGKAALRLAGDAADNAAAALTGRGSVAVIPGSAPDALGVLAAAIDDKFTGPARPLYLRPPDVSLPKSRANGGGLS